MTQTIERNEDVADVNLTSTILGLAKHTELDVKALQECAAHSDDAWERGDYEEAIDSARALLVGLVKGIALELRRPRDESAETFRARKRAAGSYQKCCRFLQQQRFLDQREKNNAHKSFVTASIPADDGGVSVEAWGRIARQMVFATVKRITSRLDAWKTGCSCEDTLVDVIGFQPMGGASVYHRSVCRACRCPREHNTTLERAMTACGAAATGKDEARAAASIEGGAGVAQAPTALPRSPSDLPADLSEALSKLDTLTLMAVCVRCAWLLYERK